MKVNNQYNRKVIITHIWEVKINRDLWTRINCVAKSQKVTCSWITRYCIFRLARKGKIAWKKPVTRLYNKIYHEKYDKDIHRHLVCLYGEDEQIIRMTAMSLGITVSALIRIALHWFLRKLERNLVNQLQLFWFGIKFCKQIQKINTFPKGVPISSHLRWMKFSEEDWFDTPDGRILLPMINIS